MSEGFGRWYLEKPFHEITTVINIIQYIQRGGIPLLLQIPGAHSEFDVIDGDQDDIGLGIVVMLVPDVVRLHLRGVSISIGVN
jgi:hypothetical protein